MEKQQEEKLTKEQLQAIHGFAVNVGKSYQPEFVEMLASTLYDLVLGQMKRANMSEDAINLLEYYSALKTYALELKSGSLSDVGADDLAVSVPAVTQLIWKMGGSFVAGDGESTWTRKESDSQK